MDGIHEATGSTPVSSTSRIYPILISFGIFSILCYILVHVLLKQENDDYETADPAAWGDWIECVDKVQKNRKMLLLIFLSMVL